MSPRNGSASKSPPKETKAKETVIPTVNNTLHDLLKGLEESSLMQVLIKGLDKQDTLRDYVDKRFDHFERRIYDLEEQLRLTNTRAVNAEKRVESLEQEKQTLVKQIENNNNNIDDMETASRIPYLVVNNIPANQHKTDEEIFIDLCNVDLGLTDPISKDDIANVSRLRGKGPREGRTDKPDAILIKFQNEKARNKVFSNKSKLKGSGKVISEFLTQKKNIMLKKCRETIPGSIQDRSIWTHNGKILVRMNNTSAKTFEIKSSNDIHRFLVEHNLTACEPPDTT